MDILGLSYDIDAAAALLCDGDIVAAVAEERFSRVKHDRDYPRRASAFCLAHAGRQLADLDWIALGWNPTLHLRPLLWRRSTRLRHPSEYLSAVPNLLLQELDPRPSGLVTEQIHHFADSDRPLRVAYVDHHLAHAAWAFVSPFERAAVLTVDGFGEEATTQLAICEDRELRVIQRVERPHSLGSFYAAITQHLGFRANSDEGIVMSLAALGEPRFADDLRELVRFRADGRFELDLTYFDFYREGLRRVSGRFLERFGPPRGPDDDLEPRHHDLAASLQQVFEEAYLRLLDDLHRRTGCTDVVVAGGAALNCVANGKIREATPFERVFIPPATGDDGAAAGAALYLHHAHLGRPRAAPPLASAALGPDCDAAQVQGLLTLARRSARRADDPPSVAARLLAEGFVVGWYQGRAEYGPRALGQRSILGDPRDRAIRDRINRTIKFRHDFRPLAPAVLVDRCGELFDDPAPSPFMLRASRVRPAWRERLQAAIHVDDTARVQTVDPQVHPRFAALIGEFAHLTGVPAVLNTSLNVRGQPIANSPEDALACFDSTALDHLFLGDSVLAKADGRADAALSRAMDGGAR